MRHAATVAVIQDIHGNLPALEAVLADVEAANVDAVVINGDIADGPFPAETIELLSALSDKAVWIRGNGDRWLVQAFDGVFKPSGDPADAVVQWAAARLGSAHRDRLAALPLAACIEVRGLGPVCICHATSRSDNEMFLVDSSVQHFRDAFAQRAEPTIVVGHTHMPFDRLFDRRRLINAGSVGMPYGHTGASWALLGPDVVLRRTAYDAGLAAARFEATGMPGARSFIDENVRATPSDAEAHAIFSEVRCKQARTGIFDRTASGRP